TEIGDDPEYRGQAALHQKDQYLFHRVRQADHAGGCYILRIICPAYKIIGMPANGHMLGNSLLSVQNKCYPEHQQRYHRLDKAPAGKIDGTQQECRLDSKVAAQKEMIFSVDDRR